MKVASAHHPTPTTAVTALERRSKSILFGSGWCLTNSQEAVWLALSASEVRHGYLDREANLGSAAIVHVSSYLLVTKVLQRPRHRCLFSRPLRPTNGFRGGGGRRHGCTPHRFSRVLSLSANIATHMDPCSYYSQANSTSYGLTVKSKDELLKILRCSRGPTTTIPSLNEATCQPYTIKKEESLRKL